MKVLVTGAAGRLGSVVIRLLSEQGFEVIGADRRIRADLVVPVIAANLLDATAVYGLVQTVDAIVHLGNHPHASSSDPQGLYADNCTINANVFQAASDLGVSKVVFASSIQAVSGKVYGRWDEEAPRCQLPYLPMDGDLPFNPGNTYGASKVAGETLLAYFCRHQGMSGVSLRFPFMTSAEVLQRRLSRMRRWSGHNAPEAFSYLAFEDAAALIHRILVSDLPGYRVYLPADRGNSAGLRMSRLYQEHLSHVPLRVPLEQFVSPADNI